MVKRFLVILCGIPCSGKSTLAKAIAKLLEEDFDHQTVVVTSDVFRSMFSTHRHKLEREKEHFIQKATYETIETALEKGLLVISDDTNHNTSMRRRLVNLAIRSETDYAIIHVNTPLEVAIDWNKKRGEPISSSFLEEISLKFDELGDEHKWDKPLMVLDPSGGKLQELAEVATAKIDEKSIERMESLGPTLSSTNNYPQRLLEELEDARSIQKGFFSETPKLEGFDLAAFNRQAEKVGGDFYDFIPISKYKHGLAIADVSGSGIPAALFMALYMTLIHTGIKGNTEAGNAIKKAHSLICANPICANSKSRMFVTLFYAILDSKKMSLNYINAGHNPPILLKKASGKFVLLEARGIPLGLKEPIRFQEEEIPLTKGDLVILYTDGITEAMNKEGKFFGKERLKEVVENNYALSADDITQEISQKVLAFSEGHKLDDITLVILKALKN